MRRGDQPTAALAIFNETSSAFPAALEISGGGLAHTSTVRLQPGVNYVTQRKSSGRWPPTPISVRLRRSSAGSAASPAASDALDTRFAVIPTGWRTPHTPSRWRWRVRAPRSSSPPMRATCG